MNIHMPGWLRLGDEVLDIVLEEMNVSPAKVSLAHSDPSGKDVVYQRKMLDRGVWLEFDMIGLDITFPKEGVAPGVQETADAVANLIALGYADQIVLSHDVFLKTDVGEKMAEMAGGLSRMSSSPIWLLAE
ncbi:phosphotriesterase [Salmonella enterica subsp. enterica]|nr:phosphotriesterase [Salmonella enterica subsp. enterica]